MTQLFNQVPAASSPSSLSRRTFLTAMGGTLAAWAVAGCTNDSLDPPAAAPGSSSPDTTEATDAPAVFPVAIAHRFGETTIPAQPQRIVALGQTDCDPLIALGITPIAIGSFAQNWYNPVHPWNEDGFTDGKPEELNFFEIEFERIAALGPDLITMVSGGITKSDYETLSKIAPVVAIPEGYTDSAVPLRPHTLQVARCVGLEEEATALVDDVDAQYAAAREAHPEWGSMSAIHAECYTGAFSVLGKNAPRTEFLTAIGFTLSPELDKITGDLYTSEISAEQLNLVGDLDLVVWCTDPGAVDDLQDNPVAAQLPNVQEGRSIWTTYDKSDQFMWSMDWNTVLSAPYALELGVPLVESALAGESPTSTDA